MENEILDGDKTPNNDNGEGTPENSEGQNLSNDKELQTYKAQNKHFRDRTEKLEAEIKTLKETPGNVDVAGIEERVNARLAGHSSEELEVAGAFAKGKGITLTQALQDPFIKAGIEATRQSVKAEQATPPPSGTSTKIAGKTFDEMSKGERQVNIDALFEAKAKELERGGNKSI